MNKEILIVLLVAICLITSVGVISAANDSHFIPVKIVRNGDGNIPDFVIVELIKDGKVIDTKKITAEDSWKTTFKVDDDGNYKVKEKTLDGCSFTVSKDGDGFIIKNVFDKEEVIGVSNDESVAADEFADEDMITATDDESILDVDATGGKNLTDGNGTGNSNSTDNSTGESNSTDNSTDDATVDTNDDVDDAADDSDDEKTITTTKTTTTTKIIKQEKKPVNTTSNNIKTGFPIVVLVIAVFVAAFIPLSRRK